MTQKNISTGCAVYCKKLTKILTLNSSFGNNKNSFIDFCCNKKTAKLNNQEIVCIKKGNSIVYANLIRKLLSTSNGVIFRCFIIGTKADTARNLESPLPVASQGLVTKRPELRFQKSADSKIAKNKTPNTKFISKNIKPETRNKINFYKNSKRLKKSKNFNLEQLIGTKDSGPKNNKKILKTQRSASQAETNNELGSRLIDSQLRYKHLGALLNGFFVSFPAGFLNVKRVERTNEKIKNDNEENVTHIVFDKKRKETQNVKKKVKANYNSPLLKNAVKVYIKSDKVDSMLNPKRLWELDHKIDVERLKREFRLSKVKKNNPLIVTGIKAIDLFAPFCSGYDVGFIGNPGCGKRSFIKQVVSSLYKKQFFVTIYGVFQNPIKRYKAYGREQIFPLENDDWINRKHSKNYHSIMFYSRLHDFPARKIFALETAYKTAEAFAEHDINSLFVYENRPSVVNAFNEINYDSNKKLFQIFEKEKSKNNYVNPDLQSIDIFNKKKKSYPEAISLMENHLSTIFCCLSTPLEVLTNITQPPHLQFNEKDSLVVFNPLLPKNHCIIDPVRSFSRYFDSPFVSPKHKSVQESVKNCFIKQDKARFLALAATPKTKKKRSAVSNTSLEQVNSGIEFKTARNNEKKFQNIFQTRIALLSNYLLTQKYRSFVPLKTTLDDCIDILNGKLDGVHAERLKNIGSLKDIL